MEERVKEVVVTIDGQQGSRFSLVLFEDGQYGITRDGAPVTRCGSDLKECLRSLQALAGIGGEAP